MAYVDPGSLMPVGSAVAAIIGVILLFGHRIVARVRRMLGRAPADTTPSQDQVGQPLRNPEDEG
jgi:hypothetical protein